MLGSISISDINEALPNALPLLYWSGVRHTADSLANARETIEWPGLFITEWQHPTRNVLFDPIRDANPFFHYLEAMWILAGRNDVKFLSHVLPRMAEYSDDGRIFHGAYGYRLRHWTGQPQGMGHYEDIDQIQRAIDIFKKSPNSRQVVLGIWDPATDLGAKTKDMPCNDMLMLKIRNGALNLTVANRSNDAVLGCYGANAVQFSTLLMYLAARIGVKVGTYCQVSDSFHVYTDNPYWKWFIDRYQGGQGGFNSDEPVDAWAEPLRSSRLMWNELDDRNFFEDHHEQIDDDLNTFFIEAKQSILNDSSMAQFARSTAVRTAIRMWNVLYWHRHHNDEQARTEIWDIEPDGWRTAAKAWLEKRSKK